MVAILAPPPSPSTPRRKYQAFDAMGFSEAFQRGTQIYGAGGLSPANTSRVLDLLYSNQNGAGMTILRNGIGSSLTNPYGLMKSIETVSPGLNTSAPHYDWEGTVKPGFGLDSGQLQITKDALACGVQKVYADARSAPGFMKNNSNDSYGAYLCGVVGIECATCDWRQAYANYLVDVTYASMLSDGQQAADFLEQREWLEGIEAEGAEHTLGLVTAHGYSSPPSTPFATTRKVWQTEWADLSGPHTLEWYYNGSSGEGLTWANNIQQLFAVSNVSAALYWIGADNTTSNSALILIQNDTVQVSKRLWAFAQYSRFVKPGATRINVAATGAAFNLTAFENADGSVAVQVINNNNATETVTLQGLTLRRHSSVAGWLTNNANDLTRVPVRSVGRGKVQASIPALSMMSIVSS